MRTCMETAAGEENEWARCAGKIGQANNRGREESCEKRQQGRVAVEQERLEKKDRDEEGRGNGDQKEKGAGGRAVPTSRGQHPQSSFHLPSHVLPIGGESPLQTCLAETHAHHATNTTQSCLMFFFATVPVFKAQPFSNKKNRCVLLYNL